jgi:hypothetical protein
VTEERMIGARTYRATQLPAMRALRLLARLGRVAGPAFAVLLEAGAEGSIQGGARALFDRLGEDDVEQLVRGMLETVTVDGRSVLLGFDAEYAGKLDEVFLLVQFALEVQFGGFFAALAAATKGAAAVPVSH